MSGRSRTDEQILNILAETPTRLAALTVQDRGTIRGMNPRTWIKSTGHPEQEFQAALRAFTSRRTYLLTVLKALSPAGWSRGATVSRAGRVLERSVLSYAKWMASHERPHVRQVGRIVEALRCQAHPADDRD